MLRAKTLTVHSILNVGCYVQIFDTPVIILRAFGVDFLHSWAVCM